MSDKFNPTLIEREAINRVDRVFRESKEYWESKHKRQRRLWARYLNSKLTARPTGYSNEQLGQHHRIADIIHSMLVSTLLKENPYGKINAEGPEDYQFKEIIDKVNAFQQRQKNINGVVRDALLHSVISCGVIMTGWDESEDQLILEVPETITLADPSNPLNEIEVPNGKVREEITSIPISQFDATIVQPWNLFPNAGATDPRSAHTVIARIRMSREELKAMQRAGELENVELIDENAYGVFDTEQYVRDDIIMDAQREDFRRVDTKDSIWILYAYTRFPFFKHQELSEEREIASDDEFETIIIKPQHDDTILKLKLNKLNYKPIVMMPYTGTDDMFFGVSAMEIAEKLIQLGEDMFNMTQDAAKNEVYRKILADERINQGDLSPASLNPIVKVPKEVNKEPGSPINEIPARPNLMPNLAAQRVVIDDAINEISIAIALARATGTDPEETATKTQAELQFFSQRLENRITFYEDGAFFWFMQWQVILNIHFLESEFVQRLTGLPAALDPFRDIIPTLPIRSFDFTFEAAKKAMKDPVQAQILRQLLGESKDLLPGRTQDGRLRKVNSMALYEEILKKSDVTDDIDKFFEDVDENASLQEPGEGGPGQEGLGAVTEADLLSSVNSQGNAGIRRELR